MKYHTLLPSAHDVGGAVDYYQWSALLRSVSAFSSYRKIYRDVITPFRVAELLILRDDVPRSLHACMNADLRDPAGAVATRTASEPERLAGEIHAQLHYGKTEKIFKVGLHEYLLGLPGGDRRAQRRGQQALPRAHVLPVARRARGARAVPSSAPSNRAQGPSMPAMTYCVGVLLDGGMVFASDSRTNAGVDHVSSFRKMTVYERPGDRVIVDAELGQPLGHAERDQPARAAARGAREAHANLWTAPSMFDVAAMLGDCLREVKRRDGPLPHAEQHRRQRELHPRRADQGRAAAALHALPGGQLHRGDRRDAVLPDRRDEVRQADHRPRGQALDHR